ncbi:MAG: aminoacyl-tRNA hydrolase [Byssovorax sp.]
MLLVVGLGNPGKEYASHRHNVGFMVLDELARLAKADSFRDKFSGEIARAEIAGEPAMLLKPQTFMNLSGQCVQPAMAFYKVEPSALIVVHDELDVPFGELRLKVGGGHAGHNGLRSIMASASTGDFVRLRVGVGRPPASFRGDVADYVLSGFDSAERAALPALVTRAAKVVVDIARRGLDPAMKAANTKPKPPKPPKPAPAEPGSAAPPGPAAPKPGSDSSG